MNYSYLKKSPYVGNPTGQHKFHEQLECVSGVSHAECRAGELKEAKGHRDGHFWYVSSGFMGM